jgi:MYXO-CTERM domain-containing protein
MRCIRNSALILAGAAATANAQTIPFAIFENASGVGVGGLDLALTLHDGGTYADLVIANNTTIGGVVTKVFVESPSSFTVSNITINNDGVGSKWSVNAGGNVPGSISQFSGAWEGTLASFKANPSPMKNGIGEDQFLSLRMHLGSTSFDELSAALAARDLRLVAHIQGLGNKGEYSVWGTTVPTPGAAAILGLGGAGLIRRRR